MNMAAATLDRLLKNSRLLQQMPQGVWPQAPTRPENHGHRGGPDPYAASPYLYTLP